MLSKIPSKLSIFEFIKINGWVHGKTFMNI